MPVNVRILFNADAGNAEDFAFELDYFLSQEGFWVMVTDLDAYTPAALADECVVIIVTRPCDSGAAPATALRSWLQQETASVEGVCFAVCGLVEFDRLMAARGGQQIVPPSSCEEGISFRRFTSSVLLWLYDNGRNICASQAAWSTMSPAPSEDILAAR